MINFKFEDCLDVMRCYELYSVHLSPPQSLHGRITVDCGGYHRGEFLRGTVQAYDWAPTTMFHSHVAVGDVPLCMHCNMNGLSHIDGKCLYDSTSFSPDPFPGGVWNNPRLWHRSSEELGALEQESRVRKLYLTREAASWLLKQEPGRIISWPKNLP